MTTHPKDTPVRFTAGALGTVRTLDSSRFTDHIVQQGDTGRYQFPHPNPRLPGWHIVAVDTDDGELLVPCGANQFEVQS